VWRGFVRGDDRADAVQRAVAVDLPRNDLDAECAAQSSEEVPVQRSNPKNYGLASKDVLQYIYRMTIKYIYIYIDIDIDIDVDISNDYSKDNAGARTYSMPGKAFLGLRPGRTE
jgi:hypothetical protein